MWGRLTAAAALAGLGVAAAWAWTGQASFAPLPEAANAQPLPGAADHRQAGREAFYRDSFGNTVFLSDVVGLLDGGLQPAQVLKALLLLQGQGTGNLRVAVSRPTIIGYRSFRPGDMIDTGLDVPRGGWLPLGVRLDWQRGRLRVGLTCAACHAAVDPASGRVVDGAPNADLNLGLLLALAPNSAALFPRVAMPAVAPYLTDRGRSVATSDGRTRLLPEPAPFEADIDALLAAWPAGSLDTTPDLVGNPVQIPDLFNTGTQPAGWSGDLAVTDRHHGLGDGTADADGAPRLFGLDPEVHLGILLQNAPGALRFTPGGGPPSARLPPRRPAADGTALAAFVASLRPPLPQQADTEAAAAGRQVFLRAGCARCHDGPTLSNDTVVPVAVLGAEPSRDGYRVKGLIGLAWSAPYLHDGSSASLAVLLDRSLRAPLQAELRSSAAARASHVTGQGHGWWVDAQAGYAAAEQQALIAYLLSLTGPVEMPPPAVAASGEPP